MFGIFLHLTPVNKGDYLTGTGSIYVRTLEENTKNHFEAWRCILLTPTQITAAVEKMEKQYPDAKIKIVDWPNFLHLRKQWLELPRKPAKKMSLHL